MGLIHWASGELMTGSSGHFKKMCILPDSHLAPPLLHSLGTGQVMTWPCDLLSAEKSIDWIIGKVYSRDWELSGSHP